MRPQTHFFVACALALASFSTALAAETLTEGDKEQQVLFEPKSMFPAQGGPEVKAAFLGDKLGLLIGGSGSLVLDEGLGIGIGGYSLSNELTTEFDGAVHDVGMSYFGLLVENNFFPRRLFYLNFSTMIGLGQAYAVARQAGALREHALFFIAEPEINWMLNVTRELRIGLGGSYRLVAGNDLSKVLGIGLNGFAVKLTLFYGKL